MLVVVVERTMLVVVVAGAALQRLCPQKHCSVSPLCLHSDTPEVGGSGAQERVSSEPSRSLRQYSTSWSHCSSLWLVTSPQSAKHSQHRSPSPVCTAVASTSRTSVSTPFMLLSSLVLACPRLSRVVPAMRPGV